MRATARDESVVSVQSGSHYATTHSRGTQRDDNTNGNIALNNYLETSATADELLKNLRKITVRKAEKLLRGNNCTKFCSKEGPNHGSNVLVQISNAENSIGSTGRAINGSSTSLITCSEKKS